MIQGRDAFFLSKTDFGSFCVHWIAGEAKSKSIVAAKSPRPDGVHYIIIQINTTNTLKTRLNNITRYKIDNCRLKIGVQN